MNKVYADLERNRLVIKYGELTIDGYMAFAEEILQEASKLRKGFTVFSDLREFNMKNSGEIMAANVADITKVQHKLYDLGSSEVIRVVDPQVWLFVAMQEAEKNVGYNAIIFDDMDEAMDALEDIESELVEQNGEI